MCYIGAEYLLQRDGIFYYNRRIPDDVSAQYASKRVVFSLKTRSRSAALKSAASVTGQLEKQWLHFRSEKWPIPVLTNKTSHSTGTSLCGATLSDALDVYVRLKGGEKGTKFIADVPNLNYHRCSFDEYSWQSQRVTETRRSTRSHP